jgi:chromosome segregation ATPase
MTDNGKTHWAECWIDHDECLVDGLRSAAQNDYMIDQNYLPTGSLLLRAADRIADLEADLHEWKIWRDDIEKADFILMNEMDAVKAERDQLRAALKECEQERDDWMKKDWKKEIQEADVILSKEIADLKAENAEFRACIRDLEVELDQCVNHKHFLKTERDLLKQQVKYWKSCVETGRNAQHWPEFGPSGSGAAEMTKEKKYEFTGKIKTRLGIELKQIRALRDLRDSPVAKGDIGGWIEAEKNLSHAGDAWVSGDASVSGNA